jgi:hypothetical protein
VCLLSGLINQLLEGTFKKQGSYAEGRWQKGRGFDQEDAESERRGDAESRLCLLFDANGRKKETSVVETKKYISCLNPLALAMGFPRVAASPRPRVPASPRPRVPVSPRPRVPASPRPRVPASPCRRVPASPRPRVPASPRQP